MKKSIAARLVDSLIFFISPSQQPELVHFKIFYEYLWKKIISASQQRISIFYLFSNAKTTLMISRKIINRVIILAFFVLIGYCLATSIAVKSIIGIVLATISMGAGVTFLYLLAKQQQKLLNQEQAPKNLIWGLRLGKTNRLVEKF